jgi:hypothetical protein
MAPKRSVTLVRMFPAARRFDGLQFFDRDGHLDHRIGMETGDGAALGHNVVSPQTDSLDADGTIDKGNLVLHLFGRGPLAAMGVVTTSRMPHVWRGGFPLPWRCQ